MNYKLFIPGVVLATTALSLSAPPVASADPFCFSFGLYANCVESPYCKAPAPVPIKPLPIWVCKTVFTASAIGSVIPQTAFVIWPARIMLIPVVYCLWD